MDLDVPSTTPNYLECILVIGFHHTKGNLLEYCFPKQDRFTDPKTNNFPVLPSQWESLAFLAMPDGAHLSPTNTAYVYFTLPPLKSDMHSSSIYGVSCFRQIHSHLVNNKSPDQKRSRIQKSVVILSKIPAWDLMLSHVYKTSMNWFHQKFFLTDTKLLEDLYTNLNLAIHKSLLDQSLYLNLFYSATRDIFLRLGNKILVLFKSLLLSISSILFCPLPVHLSNETIMMLLHFVPNYFQHASMTPKPLDFPSLYFEKLVPKQHPTERALSFLKLVQRGSSPFSSEKQIFDQFWGNRHHVENLNPFCWPLSLFQNHDPNLYISTAAEQYCAFPSIIHGNTPRQRRQSSLRKPLETPMQDSIVSKENNDIIGLTRTLPDSKIKFVPKSKISDSSPSDLTPVESSKVTSDSSPSDSTPVETSKIASDSSPPDSTTESRDLSPVHQPSEKCNSSTTSISSDFESETTELELNKSVSKIDQEPEIPPKEIFKVFIPRPSSYQPKGYLFPTFVLTEFSKLGINAQSKTKYGPSHNYYFLCGSSNALLNDIRYFPPAPPSPNLPQYTLSILAKSQNLTDLALFARRVWNIHLRAHGRLHINLQTVHKGWSDKRLRIIEKACWQRLEYLQQNQSDSGSGSSALSTTTNIFSGSSSKEQDATITNSAATPPASPKILSSVVTGLSSGKKRLGSLFQSTVTSTKSSVAEFSLSRAQDKCIRYLSGSDLNPPPMYLDCDNFKHKYVVQKLLRQKQLKMAQNQQNKPPQLPPRTSSHGSYHSPGISSYQTKSLSDSSPALQGRPLPAIPKSNSNTVQNESAPPAIDQKSTEEASIASWGSWFSTSISATASAIGNSVNSVYGALAVAPEQPSQTINQSKSLERPVVPLLEHVSARQKVNILYHQLKATTPDNIFMNHCINTCEGEWKEQLQEWINTLSLPVLLEKSLIQTKTKLYIDLEDFEHKTTILPTDTWLVIQFQKYIEPLFTNLCLLPKCQRRVERKLEQLVSYFQLHPLVDSLSQKGHNIFIVNPWWDDPVASRWAARHAMSNLEDYGMEFVSGLLNTSHFDKWLTNQAIFILVHFCSISVKLDQDPDCDVLKVAIPCPIIRKIALWYGKKFVIDSARAIEMQQRKSPDTQAFLSSLKPPIPSKKPQGQEFPFLHPGHFVDPSLRVS